MIGGTPVPGEEDDDDFSYPKAIAAVLPRTDFATLFKTLPKLLQEALAAPDTTLGYSRFTSLMEMLARRSNKPGLDEPVLGYRAWSQITDTTIVQDVTRRTWADGIVAGQDRLTQVGYGEWLDQRAHDARSVRLPAAQEGVQAARLDRRLGRQDGQGQGRGPAAGRVPRAGRRPRRRRS